MKRFLITVTFVFGTATMPVHAGQTEHAPTVEVQEDLSGPHGHSGMSYDDEGMQQHLEQMEEMQELLKRARATENPVKRARYIVQHQDMMEKRMAVIMTGNKAEMLNQCHQQMTMMHDLMWEMAAQMEILKGLSGVQEHYWGSPAPDE